MTKLENLKEDLSKANQRLKERNFNIIIFGAQLRSSGVELRKCAKLNL